MPEADRWRPVAEPQRALALDALRGFAILGVLVANTLTFAYPIASSTPELSAWQGTGAADRLTVLLVGLFVEGKFYTLLSVLFGAGLALQMDRARAAGRAFVPFHLRRAAALFAVGLVHGVLLYSADILTFYALISVAVLPFRHLPARRLAALAVLSASAGVFVLSVYAWSHPNRPFPGPPNWHDVQQGNVAPDFIERGVAGVMERVGVSRDAFFMLMDDETRISREGTWLEAARLRAASGLLLALPSKVCLLGFLFLAYFLCGMFLVRRAAILSDSGRSTPLSSFLLLDRHTRTRWNARFFGGVSLGLGLVVVAGGFRLMLPRMILTPVIYWGGTFAGVFVQAAGYASGILGICASRPNGIIVRGLAAVGRTALTNYLAQSVMLGLVFYGTGLGMFTRLTAAPVVALAIPVFGLEVWMSQWWLERWTSGPAEWAWRSLSYGAWLPFRRADRQAPSGSGAAR